MINNHSAGELLFPITSHAESVCPTHQPPSFCLLLMDRTCQCCVAGPSSYGISHGQSSSTPAISPTPNPKVTKRENKSNNSVSHYSACQQMVPISSVCVRASERHHVNVLFSIHSLLTYKALCALSPSFGLLLPLTPSLISQLCLHAHNFDTQV